MTVRAEAARCFRTNGPFSDESASEVRFGGRAGEVFVTARKTLVAGLRALRSSLLGLLLIGSVPAALAAEPADEPGGAEMPGPAPSGPRNLIMGTGEAREPQPFTREQRLLDAARRGDRETVERALALGVPVDSADDLSRSALLLAARDAGDLDLVRYLHDQGGAIDRADAGGRTPLSFSASAGRLDLVRYFVAEGAEVDNPDGRGRTPLFHAVLGNQIETVRYLIEQGADVNVKDRFSDTPLMMACSKGYAEMAGLLIDHGADRSARDQEGRTAADRAAPSLEVCRSGESA